MVLHGFASRSFKTFIFTKRRSIYIKKTDLDPKKSLKSRKKSLIGPFKGPFKTCVKYCPSAAFLGRSLAHVVRLRTLRADLAV